MGKQAQEAHEAIRPTSLDYPPTVVKPFLGKDEFRLYTADLEPLRRLADGVGDLRRDPDRHRRPAASPSAPAARSCGIPASSPSTTRRRTSTTSAKEDGTTTRTAACPDLEGGAGGLFEVELLTPRQHFTQPPPRFSEATLVKELEENGIGRPSTYATIIATITNRDYASQGEPALPADAAGLPGQRPDGRQRSSDICSPSTTRRGWKTSSIASRKASSNWVEALKDFQAEVRQADLERAQGRAHARRQARGDPDRPGLREVRQGDGAQVGPLRPVHRLLGLPRLQEHQGRSQGDVEFDRSSMRRRRPRRPRSPRSRRSSRSASRPRPSPCEKCGEGDGAASRGRLRPLPRLLGLPRLQEHAQDGGVNKDGTVEAKADVLLEEDLPEVRATSWRSSRAASASSPPARTIPTAVTSR